ncbi:hypothetical protein ACWKSP_39330 [Micromonosporaceae bacterium Da 78-11]
MPEPSPQALAFYVNGVRRAHPPAAGPQPALINTRPFLEEQVRRRDFHLIGRFPAGLVAIGDAVASFNPVYGQGMTSAALHASALSELLRSGPDLSAPATAYFDRVRVVVDAAWEMSTFADLALPHVDGPYPKGYRVKNAIGNMIYDAAADDRVINDRLGLVTTMLAHPSAPAEPRVVLRALRLRVLSRRTA